MVKTAQIIEQLRRESLIRLNQPVTMMFVIEEETGGNGSLSLVLDRELRRDYDSLLVLECADLGLYPANRGAVWYRTELTLSSDQSTAGFLMLGAAAWMILAMEEEGAAIKAESDHPLFPQRPIQTCHGIIGKFGEHPSRICGQAAFHLRTSVSVGKLTEIIESGLNKYIALYGDKTKMTDPETGKVKVVRHYEWHKLDDTWQIEIFGSSGHMGSILENDAAITKLAYLVKELIEVLGPENLSLQLAGEAAEAKSLVLEGGQGFVPTHDISEVMTRMSAAADRGLQDYLTCYSPDTQACSRTTYDKLHNAAFDGDPNSPTMRHAVRAMELCGLRQPGDKITGWTVSCDARLFATEYDDLQGITSGPGKLQDAHSDREHVKLDDLISAISYCGSFCPVGNRQHKVRRY